MVANIALFSNNEIEWKEPFTFVQMADCQLGFFENDVSWEKDKALLEKTVEKINALNPRFVILCGDITNARPDHPKYMEQVRDYKEIISKIDVHIPLLCLCGNHDVGDRPTPESIKAYETNFGPHFYSFWVGGVHCVALNSSLLKNPAGAPDLDKQQNEWLNEELEASNKLDPKHRFIFSHHSWFLADPNEEDSHFNIPKELRLKLLDLFQRMGTTACFSGHRHDNAYGKYEKIEVITTGASGRPLFGGVSGFRIVNVTEEGITHTYYPLE